MGDLEKQNPMKEEEEEKRLLTEDGMQVLDFDMLCSTVALQTQGKWSKLNGEEEEERAGQYSNSAFRMWEGGLLDCFNHRSIAIESFCCPCYRFGNNMKRAGFGSSFLQGFAYCFLALTMLANFIAFTVTKQYWFLYLAVAFTLFLVAYLGYFRTQIKKKFNIRGTDSSVDDCFFHLFCSCCSLAQESRTLEINNVQDGTWHGRGDICIGSYTEGNKGLFEFSPPPTVSIELPDTSSMLKDAEAALDDS